MSFVTRIKVNSIDTFEISKEQFAYDIHVPELRWGQGILLGYTYRDNNPEKNSDLFYVAKDGVKVYSISIAEIKSMEYLMIGSKQIFILPEKDQNNKKTKYIYWHFIYLILVLLE